jgi:di/tricarboxylate transporter
MKLWGVRHLPNEDADSEFLADYSEAGQYLAEFKVVEASPLVNAPLEELEILHRHEGDIVRIVRSGSGDSFSPGVHDRVEAGDVIVVQGEPEAILALAEEENGLETHGPVSDPGRLREGDLRVVEVLIPSGSTLARRSVTEMNLRRRYGVVALAVWRHGRARMSRIAHERLQAGDLLLLQGSEDAIRAIRERDDLVVMTDRGRPPVRAKWHPWAAGAAVVAALELAALNVLNIELAAILAVVFMLLTGILQPNQAYRAIDWRIVVLVGGITPLSLALQETGFTRLMADALVHNIGPLGPYVTLAVVFWIAALLTQVISNVATALVVAPLAASIAHANAWSPYPLMVMMIVALSAAPLTPLAPWPSCWCL